MELQQSDQIKVLLSAYACEPGRGSEPGVGWNIAREIARNHQVWVLTSNTHRSAIEAELKQHPVPNLHFIYLDPLGWIYDWSQEGKRAHWDVHIHYYCWQIYAYFKARQWHRTIGFNLVHHVTYVKYSSPSFVCLLPIPFIWGPVGGGESAPIAFWKDLSLRARLYEIARAAARRLGELDPFVHLTARRSCLSLATTEDTAKRLHQIGSRNIQLFSQVGLNEAEITTLSRSIADRTTLRFISIGRLIHWKGFHLGLQAFAQADLPDDAEYWIVGEGPEFKRLQRLAEELAIVHRVKFWNKLARSESLQRLGECSALVHPSLHDSGGLVCLEAMAAGCPVICLDLGGPGVQVTSETGFLIPASDPEQAILDLAKAMTQLAAHPQLCNSLGLAGKQRVQEVFSWQKKASHLVNAYQRLLALRS